MEQEDSSILALYLIFNEVGLLFIIPTELGGRQTGHIGKDGEHEGMETFNFRREAGWGGDVLSQSVCGERESEAAEGLNVERKTEARWKWNTPEEEHCREKREVGGG